jgi:hypothetical protein
MKGEILKNFDQSRYLRRSAKQIFASGNSSDRNCSNVDRRRSDSGGFRVAHFSSISVGYASSIARAISGLPPSSANRESSLIFSAYVALRMFGYSPWSR